PERKSLLLRHGQGGFGTFLSLLCLSTMVREQRHPALHIRDSEGVRKFSNQCESLVASSQSLLGIPEIPQDARKTAQAHRSAILTEQGNVGAMLVGLIVLEPLLKVLAGRDEPAQPGGSHTQRIVSL